MNRMKRVALCLLAAVLCITAFGCGKNKKPQSDPPVERPDHAIMPGFENPDPKPVTYTPVYASAFGDTIILATVPVEEWHSQESDCPPREISNGGRVKCNGEHEQEVPITKVLILEDLIPRVCSGWFRDMVQLEKIDGLEKLHTHQVSDMSFMFAGCQELSNLDIDDWYVSNVKDMTDMFKDCRSLTKLPKWYK
jgi:surface protein